MTIFRADTFDRADSATALGSPSDGGSAWVADIGTFGIQSNHGYVVALGGASTWAHLAGGGTSDWDITCTVGRATSVPTRPGYLLGNYGIAGTTVSGNGIRYDSAGAISIGSKAGGWSIYASFTGTAFTGSTSTLRIRKEFVDATHRKYTAWQDGVLLGTITVASVASDTNTQIAIGTDDSFGDTFAADTWDELTVQTPPLSPVTRSPITVVRQAVTRAAVI